MLRTNLSTRPFYNERAVHIVLAVAAGLVVVLTAFNAIRTLQLSRQNTEFSTLINRDRNEAQRLNAEAQRIRAGINQDELQATANAAANANRLIDQRTFSWTEFFNRIEDTLPDDVMLTSVQPSFDQEVPLVLMTVLGRRTEDVDAFIEKLEATGVFTDVLPRQTDPTDEGFHRVQLQALYTGAAGTAARPVEQDAGAPPGPAPEPGAPAPATEGAQPPAATVPESSKPGRGGLER